MAISFKRYIDIVSGVGAGAVVRARDLIGRLITTNVLLPTQSFIEFESADEVKTYFGATSDEYKRALFYFGWISKLITRARKLSFARWADVATAPRIFGTPTTHSLSDWTGITDGSFEITLGADTNTISDLDFSAAASLAAVATIIQTAIRAETGSMWTAAGVSYDATRGSFNLVGGVTGANIVAVEAAGTGTNILANGLLGWTSTAIFSNGAAAETPVETISASAAASDNFGSYEFLDSLTLPEIVTVAQWNTTENNAYMFLVPVLEDDAAEYYDALADYSGVAVTESGLVADEYPQMAPMLILAATDYSRINSVQNYMFQQFALTPTVTTTAKAITLDANRVNYYGRTQTAGQQIDFYQRGVLMGLPSAPVDMNVYANEQWLKSSLGAALMTLLLSMPEVPANRNGTALVMAILQGEDGIDQALRNGVISVGKTLSTVQKLYISTVTGDANAWQQIQTIGYWVNCIIESYIVDDRTEYRAVYTLLYAKDDAIRKIEGTHTLI